MERTQAQALRLVFPETGHAVVLPPELAAAVHPTAFARVELASVKPLKISQVRAA